MRPWKMPSSCDGSPPGPPGGYCVPANRSAAAKAIDDRSAVVGSQHAQGLATPALLDVPDDVLGHRLQAVLFVARRRNPAFPQGQADVGFDQLPRGGPFLAHDGVSALAESSRGSSGSKKNFSPLGTYLKPSARSSSSLS